MLEKNLEDIDKHEEQVLFLGCCRADRNKARIGLLNQLDVALKDYGK